MPEPTDPRPDESVASRLGIAGFAGPPVIGLLAVCAVGASAFRFLVDSPMWLDEALSINIASLPLAEIPDALRHDGHPPLYYVLLHGWMAIFGHSDTAVRALSGVISVCTVPLAWMAGRRLGGPRTAAAVSLVLAISPFAMRFGSETRMYSLIIAEVFALFIVLWDYRHRPDRGRLIAVAAMTALLLWTHYWSIWMLGAIGVAVMAHTIRERSRPTLELLGAMIVGAVAFLPWSPILLDQARHTGTPWAKSFRPTGLVYSSLVEFAGGPYSETQILLVGLVLCVFLGVTGRAVDHRRIEVDLHGRREALAPLGLIVATVVLASIAGAVTGMAFAPRYASVFFPFFVMLTGLGLDRIAAGRARDIALTGFAMLSLVGLYVAFSLQRSQSRDVADQITAAAPSGLVVSCPDQLGPSIERELRGGDYEVVAYPRLDDARFVDWVDYAERNRSIDPAEVARRVLDRAGTEPLFVVYRDDFVTLEGQCGELVGQLTATRPARRLLDADVEEYFEPMNALVFDAR